ncbi:MAG: hypothetical protein CM1200mP18_14670 [Gammaproteobacteria bacterium]|nr:MAG: hypothetical protein CM1200mP18_14670 [Gammaproteobacteria bacterium]
MLPPKTIFAPGFNSKGPRQRSPGDRSTLTQLSSDLGHLPFLTDPTPLPGHSVTKPYRLSSWGGPRRVLYPRPTSTGLCPGSVQPSKGVLVPLLCRNSAFSAIGVRIKNTDSAGAPSDNCPGRFLGSGRGFDVMQQWPFGEAVLSSTNCTPGKQGF